MKILDGNSSVLLGMTPGCHGEHSKHYIRRVQVNKEEEAGNIYRKANPKAVIDSVWSNNKTDYCIMFPITAKEGTKLKSELIGIEQLEVVKLLYNNWILPGMVDNHSTITNNVSNTVTVDDFEAVQDYVWNNRNYLGGISFIPISGDLEFNQPPYTEVLFPKEILDKYGEGVIFASGLIVDAEDIFGDLWKACDTFKGRGEKIFTSINDAELYIKENLTVSKEDYLNKTLAEWNKAKSEVYTKWTYILTEIGYTEDFIDQLLDSEIPIPVTEVQRFLDKQLFSQVTNLAYKRDICRRMQKYSDKYFDSDDSKMINALKLVQLYHDWCDITKKNTEIDWTKVKWKNVLIEANTTGAQGCSGGACEITKI